MLSSRSRTVLHFTSRSMINSELVHETDIKSVSRFTFFVYRCTIPALLVERINFCPLYCLYPFVQDHLTTFMGVCFRALYSDSLPVLSPNTHCHDYCSFTVILEGGSISSLALFLSVELVILNIFPLHIIFRIKFSI
jgi:hypothetical protein